MNRIGEYTKSQVQLTVNPAHLPTPFELIRRKTEPGQHYHEDETVPELQSPLDRIEDFHLSMQ